MKTSIQESIKNPVREGYELLKERISQIEGVQHVDLWNQDVMYLEQVEVWAMPAVFVEFGDVEWGAFKGGGCHGSGKVYFHIVTAWTDGGYDTAWDYTSRLYEALRADLGSEVFDIVAIDSSKTNHDHEEILEVIETYRAHYFLPPEEA